MSSRFTQAAVEVLRKPDTRNARVSQFIVEVLRSNTITPSSQQPMVIVVSC